MYKSPKKRAKFVDCILVKWLICYTPSVHFQDGWILNLLSCNFMLRKWKQRKKERKSSIPGYSFRYCVEDKN